MTASPASPSSMRGASLGSLIATLGGLGRLPASGTVGSVVALGVWMAWRLNPVWDWLVAAGLTALAIWASAQEVKRTGMKDPSQVIIDECAGMWLAVAGMPRTPQVALAGLVLFRLFDVLKPPPVRQLEALPGGLGIVLDDVAAGGISRVLLAVAVWAAYI